jgi:hypothetical protein
MNCENVLRPNQVIKFYERVPLLPACRVGLALMIPARDRERWVSFL